MNATARLLLLRSKRAPLGMTRSRGLFPFCSSSRTMSSDPHLSSFAEPSPSLYNTNQHQDQQDENASLRADIRTMGSLLGKVIQKENIDIFDKVEHLRGLAKQWREGKIHSLQDLSTVASTLSDTELFNVARAFTHFLAIANAAEGHHRGRRLLESKRHTQLALFPKNDSCAGALPALLEAGHTKESIYQALCQQCTELVLTAHPTEVNRRTVLEKKRRIQTILTTADRSQFLLDQHSYEMEQLNRALYREINSIWLTDEVSRFKPSPVQEAEKGTLVLETVLWKSLPGFVRKLNHTMKATLDCALPLDAAPIKFASWMGGDRDGNPNVQPHITREVCLNNRIKAATLFLKDLSHLETKLSITVCNAQLRELVGDNVREPYRAALRPIIEKMERTQLWASEKKAQLTQKNDSTTVSDADVYLDKDEFLQELLVLHQSLCETGNEIAADGLLTDIIRNVSAFGLTLVPLDVRQESGRHEEALDAITRFLGVGSYSQWDEESRISWLTSEIASKRPLIRSGVWKNHPDIFTPTVVDTLETFSMIADQYPGSLGAYVISQATSASDVLAVLLLQMDAGVKKPLRVAPLFETLDDLNGAGATMKKLFSLPTYMGIINGKQEVMIGYSDSAKDAGRLAASWAQYKTQEELAQIARDNNVDLTFFHGKGGTVGRGGNPQTFLAIMGHAPETINGKFRVTEQGEMINQNFGYHDRAERTLDIYTAAVLSEKLTKRPSPSDSWRSMMETLSEVSCDAYRKVVRGDERFVPYFRSATPELELSSLNIGSRPAKRKATGGVESLRAIPWIFAWTQTRLNLPAWLGVGDAVSSVLKSDKESELRDMYKNWPAFRMMIDLVEMVLAKSEPAIAKHYDEMLVKEDKAKELGAEVRKVHLQTEQAVLDLTGHSVLGENNKVLTRQLQVRNPYVDCLNILQAETLKRIREKDGEEDKILRDALMTTITGVANGMGNTG